jgi:WD40 repeat protein
LGDSVRIYDLADGSLAQSYLGNVSQVQALSWTSSGQVSSIDLTRPYVYIWNPNNLSIDHTVEASEDIQAMDWQPGSDAVVIATYEGALEYRNGTTSQLIRSYTGFDGEITKLAWNRDGTRFAAVDETGIKIWDVATSSPAVEIDIPDHTEQSIDWNSDGTVLASGNTAGIITLWDTATGQTVRTITSHDESIRAVTWSPDGSRLASGGTDGMVYVWNSDNGSLTHSLSGHTATITDLAWQSDGLLASSSLDNTVRIWTMAGGQVISSVNLHADGVPIDLDWNADASMLAVGSSDGKITLVAEVQPSSP